MTPLPHAYHFDYNGKTGKETKNCDSAEQERLRKILEKSLNLLVNEVNKYI